MKTSFKDMMIIEICSLIILLFISKVLFGDYLVVDNLRFIGGCVCGWYAYGRKKDND